MVGKLVGKALKTKIRHGTEIVRIRQRSNRERKIARIDKYVK